MHLFAAVMPALFGEERDLESLHGSSSCELRIAMQRDRTDAERRHRDASGHMDGDAGKRPHCGQ
jgi:hypothetical protein